MCKHDPDYLLDHTLSVCLTINILVIVSDHVMIVRLPCNQLLSFEAGWLLWHIRLLRRGQYLNSLLNVFHMGVSKALPVLYLSHSDTFDACNTFYTPMHAIIKLLRA